MLLLFVSYMDHELQHRVSSAPDTLAIKNISARRPKDEHFLKCDAGT